MVSFYSAKLAFNQVTRTLANLRGGGSGEMIQSFFNANGKEVRIGEPEYNISLSDKLALVPRIECRLDHINIDLITSNNDGVEINLRTYAKLHPSFLDSFEDEVHLKSFFMRKLLKECEKEHQKNSFLTGAYAGIGIVIFIGITSWLARGRIDPTIGFLAAAMGLGCATLEMAYHSSNWGIRQFEGKEQEVEKEQVLASNFSRDDIEASIKAEYAFYRQLPNAKKHQLDLNERKELKEWAKYCPRQLEAA